jgi:hypothetical protein
MPVTTQTNELRLAESGGRRHGGLRKKTSPRTPPMLSREPRMLNIVSCAGEEWSKEKMRFIAEDGGINFRMKSSIG